MKPRDEKISGIYCISFIGSPKCYIGSSIDICKRGNQHYNSLLAQKHRNKKLQNAFNLFGKYSFCFTIIEKVPFIEKSTVEKIKELRKLEQDYLDSILLANTDEKYFRENSYNLSKLTVAGCSINSSKGKATLIDSSP